MMDSIVLEEPSFSTTFGVEGGGGGRAIDRHNPIIRDEKRLTQGRIFPSTSTVTTDQPLQHYNVTPDQADSGDQKRKSVAFADDDVFLKADGFISQASSSRCLLSDHKATFNLSSELHHISPSPPHGPLNSLKGNACKNKDDDLLSSSPPPEPLTCYDSKASNNKHRDSMFSATPKWPSPPPPTPPSSDQVVVLEVSLHCRGCERKMKKHISKIEGVTSFKIEFEAKKVTVVGDVTALAVLTSVLKVKNAKLLTPATISS